MVEITFLGHSGIRIRGKKVTLVIDPPNFEILQMTQSKKITADLVLLTQKEVRSHSNLAIVQSPNGEIFQISGPGEYEILGTEIEGVAATSKSSCQSDSNSLTIYQILLDGLNLVYLGTISKLNQNQIEQLSAVDILFLPAGGVGSLEPKEAVNIITTLEPAIVIPIHFSEGEEDGLGTIGKFLAQVSKIPTENAEKLQVSREKLPDEVKIVVLNRIKN